MDIPCQDIKSIDNVLFIEHNVQRIITQQEQNGVYFDKTRAAFYIHVLRGRQEDLYRRIRPYLSMELGIPYPKPISRPFLKSGEYHNSVKKWYDSEEIHRVSGPFTRVSFLEPDLSKRAKLITQLLRLGWKPTHFTKKGNPQLTPGGSPCDSLSRISGTIGQWIADWYVYSHRESQITSWLGLVRSDGRISAEAITIGTPTFRFRHKGLVNVPKAKAHVLFGKRMRSLFAVKDRNYRMVGHDASGLELRMLADAINDDDFTNEILDGDIHEKNKRDAGLHLRDDAKTFIYAFIYGGGDQKLGAIVGGSRRKGAILRQQFLRNNPRLAECIKNTKLAAGRGYLVGLDGRKIILRRDPITNRVQDHKALNARLQTAGATVMKWSMVILDSWIQEYSLDAKKLIDMHDEGQHKVHLKDINMFKLLAPLSIKVAGEMLNLNIPLAGDVKVGLNWSHTH